MEDIEDSEEEWGECVELDVRCPELASITALLILFLRSISCSKSSLPETIGCADI
jgi:hypothetical protein